MKIRVFFLNRILKKKLTEVKLIVSDVDGVLTNGQLIYSMQEHEIKSFNVKDGMAVMLLKSLSIEIALISGGDSLATKARAKSLSIDECYTRVSNKRTKIKEIQDKLGILPKNTLYIGDDVNDLVVLDRVSLFVTPKDANYRVIRQANIKLRTKGGEGVLREICDLILYLNDSR